MLGLTRWHWGCTGPNRMLCKPMSMRIMSILLVEDDPSLRTSLKGFLEDHGFETHAAQTRAEAAEMIRRIRPAVCLLDMNLPDGSGADILRLIVGERLPVKVIVMTAYGGEVLLGRFPESVLVDVMVKPVSPDQLLDRVNQITAERID